MNTVEDRLSTSPGLKGHTMVAVKERRIAKRQQLDWPVRVWHEPTQKFYNARSVNVSASGALITLPLTAPIRISETIEATFPPPPTPDDTRHDHNSCEKVFSSQVVRVNRPQSLLTGSQQVALRFL